MKISKGIKVATPRFGVVTIEEVFDTYSAAKENGYKEPTHYHGEIIVLGKSIGVNRMVFAAIPKEGELV